MAEELKGRAFARLQVYPTLAEDLREETAAAQTLLTEKKAEVFTPHHSALVKVPQSVRGKELLDFLEKWVKEQKGPEEPAEAGATEEKPAESETTTEEAAKAEEPKAEEPKSDEQDAVKPDDVEVDEPKEGDEEENPADAAEEKKEEKPKKQEKKKAVEPVAPSPYRIRAKEIAEAFVVKGFLTAYKDRVKNYLATAPKEYITDSELYVPISEEITEAKTTSVWSVVEGAIYADQLKRKAGMLSAFTAGKDVYVVVNEQTKKIYLFESDLARASVAEFDAAEGFVQFDGAHFPFGVKLVYGDKFELLNLVTKEAQETFLNTLLNVGVQYREVHALDVEKVKSFYELKDFDMASSEVSMDKYKGKVVLVVNVSSKCGLTPINYPELQQLHEKYHDEGLEILAFPCNQFAGQEPGTHEEIMEFVKQYNCTFTFFEKKDVNGAGARPVFTYLKAKLPGAFGNYIKWNFTKFLVDRNGQPFKRYAPKDAPLSFEEDIKELLAQVADPEPVEEEAKEETVEFKEATTEATAEPAKEEVKTDVKEAEKTETDAKEEVKTDVKEAETDAKEEKKPETTASS